MSEETIRTTVAKVIQDRDAPAALRELALEALHWRLRDRLLGRASDRVPDHQLESEAGG